jgi:Methyltransferase FkbM domain
MITLDEFVTRHVQHNSTIDTLFIDTEGFDWRVLREANSTEDSLP